MAGEQSRTPRLQGPPGPASGREPQAPIRHAPRQGAGCPAGTGGGGGQEDRAAPSQFWGDQAGPLKGPQSDREKTKGVDASVQGQRAPGAGGGCVPEDTVGRIQMHVSICRATAQRTRVYDPVQEEHRPGPLGGACKVGKRPARPCSATHPVPQDWPGHNRPPEAKGPWAILLHCSTSERPPGVRDALHLSDDRPDRGSRSDADAQGP